GGGVDGMGIVRRRQGVAAELARPRRGPEMPQLLAGLGIERGELAARGRVAARNAGVDHAVVVGRRRGDGVTVLPASDRGLPELLASCRIERDERAVELAQEHLALAERGAAIVPAAAHRVDALID